MSADGDSIANDTLQESYGDILNLLNIDDIVSRLHVLKRIPLSELERLQNFNGNLTDQQRKLRLYVTTLAGKGQQGLDAFLKALDETSDQYEPHALLAKKLRAKIELKVHYFSLGTSPGTPVVPNRSATSTSSVSECNSSTIPTETCPEMMTARHQQCASCSSTGSSGYGTGTTATNAVTSLEKPDVEKLKTITWEKVSSVPVCCTAHTAVSLHGIVYVGGGSEECFGVPDYENSYRLDIYNPTTNQWSYPITTPYSWFAMTILDSQLLIAGGINKNHMITKKILVLKAGHWEDYSEMPSAKYQTTAVGYKSMLIIIGGTIRMGREIIILSTIELLDTTNGFWYTCNSLPSPSCQLKAAVIDEKLYLLGGFTVGYSSSQIIFASLDTISNNYHKLNWQSLPNCPWYFSSATALHNKFLLTVGGRKSSDITSQTREVCILNPSTGRWECITNIPEARSLPAVVGMNDKIVVIGGTGMDRKYSDNVWVGYFK